MKLLRASCKTLRHAKSPFWRPLPWRFLAYPLGYGLVTATRTCKQILARNRQNHRFFKGMEFCNWLLTLLICLNFAPLLAETPVLPDSGTLSSTNASYDGNALLLNGHVILDHGLGKMMAEEASLQRQEAGKDFPFSVIQLRKDVEVALKSSAHIACGSADFDFTALKGILLPAENGQVVYSDQLKRKKSEENVPLKLFGKCIELSFSKQAHDGKKTEYEVETVLAKQDVVIEYAQNFQLLADHALYRKELPNDNKSARKEFQGIITAYPKDETTKCRLLHENDIIEADTVDLNLIHSKLSLLHPKGTLATSLLPHLQKEQMHFSAEHLVWDQLKNTLALKGNIHIDEKTLGELNAQDELLIEQDSSKAKAQIKTIHAQGPASFLYKDAHGLSHKLISQGTLQIDRDQLRATADSPLYEGIVLQEKQLYYEELDTAVFADQASLDYSIADNAMQPTTLTLRGNIRLFSHDPQKPMRFGIADRLSYSLSTRTLILSADPGQKVLFWDESQGMRLSAPEVHITYDPETKQQSIKGVGKVQFAFTPDEQSKFQQFFPQLQKLL